MAHRAPTFGPTRSVSERDRVREKRGWAFPLIVIGANSIAAYLIAHLFESFIQKNLVTHLGANAFRGFGVAYEKLLQGAAAFLSCGCFYGGCTGGKFS